MNLRLLLGPLSLAIASTLVAATITEPKTHGGRYDVNTLMSRDQGNP